MLAELKSAYGKGEDRRDPVVAPLGVLRVGDGVSGGSEECYGGVEVVETITRKGFADEHPGAYAIIKAFNWTQEDCQSVMRDIFAEGMDEREAAQKWIDANRERVDEWIAAGKAAEANSTA